MRVVMSSLATVAAVISLVWCCDQEPRRRMMDDDDLEGCVEPGRRVGRIAGVPFGWL
jgi:hypothetical protein